MQYFLDVFFIESYGRLLCGSFVQYLVDDNENRIAQTVASAQHVGKSDATVVFLHPKCESCLSTWFFFRHRRCRCLMRIICALHSDRLIRILRRFVIQYNPINKSGLLFFRGCYSSAYHGSPEPEYDFKRVKGTVRIATVMERVKQRAVDSCANIRLLWLPYPTLIVRLV